VPKKMPENWLAADSSADVTQLPDNLSLVILGLVILSPRFLVHRFLVQIVRARDTQPLHLVL